MAAYPSHPPPDKKKTLHKAVRDLRKGRPLRPHPSPPKKKKTKVGNYVLISWENILSCINIISSFALYK